LTAGGTASASALNVVTGDRTVYAAYTQNVRYYTARFYDGATLMQEPQLVAYGSKATPPDTTKAGYAFVGWTPSDLTIYADTDFYGTWEEDIYAVAIDAPEALPLGDMYNCEFYGKNNDRLFASGRGNVIYNTAQEPFVAVTNYTGASNDISYGLSVIPNDEWLAMGSPKSSSTYEAIQTAKLTDEGDLYNWPSKIDTRSSKGTSPVFSHDGTKLAYSLGNGTLVIREVDDNTPWTQLKTLSGAGMKPAIFNKASSAVYLASTTATSGSTGIQLWDYTTNTKSTVVSTNAQFRVIAINSDHTRLAALCQTAPYLRIYSLSESGTTATATELKTITLPYTNGDTYGGMKSLAYSPDGKTLAVVLPYGNIMFYSAENDTYAEVQTIKDDETIHFSSCAYNHTGGRFVAVATTSPFIRVFETKTSLTE
jgi:WD40 repeat protein